MEQCQYLKFVTALHVSAYLAIMKCIEIRGNCCAFRATAVRVFVFTVFLNIVNVVPTSVSHVLPFLYACCLSSVQCGW
jgi:hypothetical protein